MVIIISYKLMHALCKRMMNKDNSTAFVCITLQPLSKQQKLKAAPTKSAALVRLWKIVHIILLLCAQCFFRSSSHISQHVLRKLFFFRKQLSSKGEVLELVLAYFNLIINKL